MPRAIRFLENPPLHPRKNGWDPQVSQSIYYDGSVDFSKLEVGDLCYYHHQGVPCKDRDHLTRLHLTQHYWNFNAGRPPLILALPNASGSPLYYLVDGQCYSNTCTKCGQKAYKNTCAPAECSPKGYYDGWTVSGAPPGITVHPSVDYDDPGPPPTKHYHGFIQNGIIGDG